MAEKTIFELSSPGRVGVQYPETDTKKYALPEGFVRDELPFPELSELDVIRHFTHLSTLNHSIDKGFYPLGSCTMKYNPRVNEEVARLPGFAFTHPLQPVETIQGNLLLMYQLQEWLKERDIPTQIYYPIPVHLQDAYRDLGYREGDFPVAERFSKRNLALPMFPELTEEEVKYVADAVHEFDSKFVHKRAG